jgi:hypothetical protein
MIAGFAVNFAVNLVGEKDVSMRFIGGISGEFE